MRTDDFPFPQDSSGIPAVAVPDDGGLRITWDAGPPRLVLAGDIDLTSRGALSSALAQARAADGTSPVRIDMAGVRFCDVAGLRLILHGGDGQPAPAWATVQNLPPHLHKLSGLLPGEPAGGPVNGAADQPGTGTGRPGQVTRSRTGGSARTPAALDDPAATPSPAARAGQEGVPGREMQPVPRPALLGRRRRARSRRRRADA